MARIFRMPPTKRKHKQAKQDGKNKKGRRQREGVEEESKRLGYKELIKENALFEKYYQGQGIIPEGEWDQFLSTMREILPSTFRITGTRSLAESVLNCLERKYFAELWELEVEGERVDPPRPLPWYPNRLAWHVNLSKRFIRKSPLLSKFHSFLVRENEQGNISRQEAVSMIPPLLLDVKPHHKVFDMCAAPGSKTAQMIEFLHAEDTETSSIPGGVVVANDADHKRCYMLVHQAKRLNSPCFMVTHHDASVFPMLYYHDENDVRLPLYYDRVLCDVPCSGDGTMRKNPTIWRKWSPSLAYGLHKLQLRLLNRGLELLSPGGRLVYSTCSLNPVEDEAVIAAEIRLCKGSVELVDCSDQLPGLKRTPGATSWKLMTKGMVWMPTLADVPAEMKHLIAPNMFPPEPQELEKLHLQRCMRILPHQQDTGGFFVAVLEKKEWLPWQRKPRVAPQQSGVVGEDSTQPSSTPTQGELKGNAEASSAETVPQEIRTSSQDTSTTSQDTLKTPQETTSTSLDTTDTIPSHNTGAPMDTIGESTSVQGSDTMADISLSLQEEPQRDHEVAMETDSSTVAVKQTSPGSEVVSETAPGVLGSASSEPRSGVSGGGQTEGGAAATEVEERPPMLVMRKSTIQKQKGYKEDPYVFLEWDSEVYKMIQPYYGLPENIPHAHMLTRTLTGKKRNIYFASHLVQEITRRNENSIKIVNIGVKVLMRCDHPKTVCSFRLSQEGIDAMAPFISSHCARILLDDLVCLLKEANPLTSSLSTLAQETIRPLGIGPAIFKYIPEPEDASCQDRLAFYCPIYLSGWVAAKSVRLYVDKKYRYHFLAVLGHDLPVNLSLDTLGPKRRGEAGVGVGASDEEEGYSDLETDLPIPPSTEPQTKASDSDLEMQDET